MKLYRITEAQFKSSAWSGFGAAEYGGRWNSPGHSLVYTATSISLAILEVLVHIHHTKRLSNFVLLEMDVPDTLIRRLPATSLPADWNAPSSSYSTMQIGDTWAKNQSSLGLVVPSVVVPQESNVLLNAKHADMATVIPSAVEVSFNFDTRLNKTP